MRFDDSVIYSLRKLVSVVAYLTVTNYINLIIIVESVSSAFTTELVSLSWFLRYYLLKYGLGITVVNRRLLII